MDAWALVLVLIVPSDMWCSPGRTAKPGFLPMLKAAEGRKMCMAHFRCVLHSELRMVHSALSLECQDAVVHFVVRDHAECHAAVSLATVDCHRWTEHHFRLRLSSGECNTHWLVLAWPAPEFSWTIGLAAPFACTLCTLLHVNWGH